MWAGPQEFSQEGVPVPVRSPPPEGAGQRPGSVWAAARAREERSARGCRATVAGGVGGVGEPRLPGQSRAPRSPAALCGSLPGRARPWTPLRVPAGHSSPGPPQPRPLA
ncbi:hypothetical protein TM43_08635 [Campylobacter jejuni subsp. jejuni]|nr:hypothetical protein TM43_08635 [Campylobacter jejuni subsp. jejuni]